MNSNQHSNNKNCNSYENLTHAYFLNPFCYKSYGRIICIEIAQWKITDKAGITFLTEKHYDTLDDVKKDFNVKDIEKFQRLDLTKKVNIIG